MERMAAKVNGTTTLILIILAIVLWSNGHAQDDIGWDVAHATNYGDMKGTETMQGACGYGDLFAEGYGLETTALSTALFHNGLACGSCYQIMCHNSKWCLNNTQTIHVTATNLCPPNYSKPYENWCNPPLKHFDLSQPMFRKIAIYEAGIVPVYYRRVYCYKKGGIKFEMGGNQYWIRVLIYNVGGVGDVRSVKIKGCNTDWLQMSQSWGQNWVTNYQLVGQTLSFQVTTSDDRMVECDEVVPKDWKFGDTYEGKQFT